MKKFLLWIWQLPQNLLGWFLTLVYFRTETYDVGEDKVLVHFKHNLFGSAVSLGNYILFDRAYLKPPYCETILPTSIKHEHGHQKQSQYLGWFYLIVIGIPSFFGNIVFRLFPIPSEKYYLQPWEAWADKLGGVVRTPENSL